MEEPTVIHGSQPVTHLNRQMIPTTSYASIYQEYLAAIKWMTSLGINLQTGRTSNYEKVMGYWKDAYLSASIDEANEAFPDFVSSLFEIVEFTRIHEALQNVPQRELNAVIDKLKKAVNGPINVASETPNSTAARNFLFEASVAAMAHLPARNVKAILNARSDTGIKFEGRKIWVECKRVTSEQALEGSPTGSCRTSHGRRFPKAGCGTARHSCSQASA